LHVIYFFALAYFSRLKGAILAVKQGTGGRVVEKVLAKNF
jgi:hypothetical protein